jgi:hypothetical protein
MPAETVQEQHHLERQEQEAVDLSAAEAPQRNEGEY